MQKIIAYQEIDSTNDEAKRLVHAASDGGGDPWRAVSALYDTVVTARSQSAGRGRKGREFLSPGGDSIYASFILEPLAPPAPQQRLTVAAAVAVCTALEKATAYRTDIKWVNDVFVDGKKVCGILAESIPRAIILGIGVNINLTHGDLPEHLRGTAGSLSMNGEERARFFRFLIDEVVRVNAAAATDDGMNALLDAYRARYFLIGRRVYVVRENDETPADAIGIDADGGLIVRYGDGARETLRSGDVSVKSEPRQIART